ncbi:MAG: TolC family protein [Candidatus Brocadiaceae bacterium]|nr:TolC family protein [Candidatus Brocadiaceae bacterium]
MIKIILPLSFFVFFFMDPLLRNCMAQGKDVSYYSEQEIQIESKMKKQGVDASLDLHWLINEAMANNPEIIAAQKRIQASKARISQAKSLDDPMFTAGSFEMSKSPLHINNDSGMLEHRFAVSQKIPFPGKLRLRGEKATEESRMSEEELREKMQEIISLVKSSFYELFYTNRAIEITQENRELLLKFAKIAETKYTVGRTTQRDVLAAQVELSTLANDIIVLKKERESIFARLNALLDRHSHAPLANPRIFEKHTMDLTIEELEDIAMENRPELKRFNHAVKRDEKELKLSKKDYYYTDFQPMVEYRQIDSRPDTWASTISVNVPWLWSKNRSKVKEAQEELQAAKTDYQYINNKTLFEVKDFFVKMQSAESTVNLYKDAVIPQAQQSLRSARVGYEADRVDFLTLLDSERILLNANLLYYRALTDYEQNLASLERAVGMQLTK